MAIVTVEFGDVITGTGYAGMTISALGKSFNITGAAGTGSSIWTFTGDWVPALAYGDVVTVAYSATDNDYADSNGDRLKDIQITAVNCLDIPSTDDGWATESGDAWLTETGDRWLLE